MLIGNRSPGGIVKMTVLTGGSGYAEPPTVTLVGGGGTGVVAQAHLSGGRVESIAVMNSGTGYTANPDVQIAVATQAVTISSVAAGTDSATITLSEAVPSTTWPIIDAGTTAFIQAWIDNTQAVVSSTAITAGAAVLYKSGSGAAARAYAATQPLRPMSFFRGRFNDVYGVDGSGRGVRFALRAEDNLGQAFLALEDDSLLLTEAGDTIEAALGFRGAIPIGLYKPAIGPSVNPAGEDSGKYVAAIQMVRAGAGYAGIPAVTLTGGTPTRNAKARAVVVNGRVDRIFVSDPGAGYQSTPTVELSGGVGSGATFNVGLNGSVASVRVLASGSGYTSAGTDPATLVFSTAQGLTGANGRVVVDSAGRVLAVNLLSAGSGATTSGITAQVTGGGGTGAVVNVDAVFAVQSLTVGNSGSGYFTPPIVTIRRDPADSPSIDAEAEASVSLAGNVNAVTVVSGGEYRLAPTAFVADSDARAQATLRDPLRGVYYCCFRYFDDTVPEQNGPVYSSISELVEVDCGDGASGITWQVTHPALDDRVAGMELWRSTADQKTILFRVGRILRNASGWTTEYTEAINDVDISDPTRDGYGLMPVTLPSGQVNARRFEPPPGEFAVAAIFQDRAWYALDTLGIRPNTLLYSEVDEPESVPPDNELIVQENGATPDKIVALIPLGPALIVAQTSHLYKLMYVAQPVIDASITLVSYRGCLHSRCWTVMEGVTFIADSNGIYAYDGNQEQSVSAPIDNKWRNGDIDFSQADKFHMSADPLTKTVRFHYCAPGDTDAVRALCYCAATQAWWEETYPVAVTASAMTVVGNRWAWFSGTGGGGLVKHSGLSDSTGLIGYSFRSGPMALDEGPSRSVSFVYKPTPSVNALRLALHYNNSQSPRPNAISTDRGSGFVSTQGGTEAVLDMKSSRSALQDANGFARAYVSGQRNDRSAGGDRHMAVAFAGTQSATTSQDAVAIYAVQIEGVAG